MSQEVRPDRVAIYIRWSTDDQGDSTTLEVQQEACQLYVRSQGWTVRKDLEFVDDGYSGGNLRRPALTALRRAIKDGRVDCVVTFKLDRLSRSVIDTVNLVLDEWDGRCYFKTARDPIDTSTPAGKMFFYLLASYAEWERNVIRERTAGGRLQRASQGRWAAGNPPYGYRVDEQKRLVIAEPEAAVIRGIFESYLKGRTVGDIVRQLQAEGAPAPGGPGQWGKPLVRRVLSNQVYMGVLQYGKFKTNPRHGRDSEAPRMVKAAAPAVKLPGAAPAIVDEGTFWTVQKLKQERDARKTKRSGRAYSSQWLLSGIAKCGGCGASFAARAPRKGRQAYYYCLGRDFKLRCDCRQIKVTDLDEWFTRELKSIYGDHVKRQQMLETLEQEHRVRIAELQASLDTTQAAIAQLERERETVRRRFRRDEISGEDYKAFMAEIDRELVGLRDQAREAEDEMARAGARANMQDVMSQLQALDIFDSLDPKDQKHLLFNLVSKLTVYRGKNSKDITAVVEWKLPVQRTVSH